MAITRIKGPRVVGRSNVEDAGELQDRALYRHRLQTTRHLAGGK